MSSSPSASFRIHCVFLKFLLFLLSIISIIIFFPMFLVFFLTLQLKGHIFYCHLFLIFLMLLFLLLILFVPSLLILHTFLLIPVVPLFPLFLLSFFLSFSFSPPCYTRRSTFPSFPLPCPFLILLHFPLSRFMFFSLLLATKYYHRSSAGAYSADTLIESWQALLQYVQSNTETLLCNAFGPLNPPLSPKYFIFSL